MKEKEKEKRENGRRRGGELTRRLFREFRRSKKKKEKDIYTLEKEN